MPELNLSIFYNHPVQVLSFLALLISIFSVWIRKTVWIWGSFGLISFGSAFASGLLSPISLIPMILFILLVWGLQFNTQGFSRFLLAGTTFLLGSALFLHLMPGFLNQSDLPYPLCLSYSKAFVGLILLGIAIPTLALTTKRTSSLARPIGLTIICTLFLVTLFYLLNPNSEHFQFSFGFFAWGIATLFFTIIPEEALLRGFLQKELIRWMGNDMKFQICAVFITAFVYLLFHLNWASNLSLLLPTFAAGLTYGILYQITKLVETTIICHFLVSSIHCIHFGHLPFFQGLPCLNFGL
jgi:uncharacterized protein